jgi:hypothetical protein
MRHASHTAQGLASLGRNGDTMLMHVSPEEVHGLQALALQHGTTLTTNPHTGLPEAFNGKSFLPMLAGLVLSPFTAGMSWYAAAALEAGAGALTAKATHQNPWIGALGAMGGAGLGSGLMGAGAGAAGSAGTGMAAIPEAGLTATESAAANTAVTNAALASGTGAVAPTMSVANAGALGAGSTAGTGIAASAAPSSMSSTWVNGMNQMGHGATNLGSKEGAGAFSKALPAGRMTYLAAAAPVLSSANEQPSIPEASTKAQGYYNTRWDPNLHVYVSPLPGKSKPNDGYWTKDYMDQGSQGGPSASQRSQGDAGSYKNPYDEIIRARSGGLMHYDEGGKIPDTSGLRSYYQSLLAAPAAPAQSQGNAEMNAWLMNMRGSPTAAQMPQQPRVPVPSQTTPSGTPGSTTPTPIKIGNPGNPVFGRTGTTASAFTWDPVTQTYITSPQTIGTGFAGGKAAGGIASLAQGGRYLQGPGDGMSDSIPATIEGKQKAALGDGEFVVPADVVSHIGNGSSNAGAKKLYSMMDQIRRARTGKTSQAPKVNADRYMPS